MAPIPDEKTKPIPLCFMKRILCAFLLMIVSTSYCQVKPDDSNRLTQVFIQYHQEMLDRFPVVFVLDEDWSGPIVNPSEFALGGTVHHGPGPDGLSLPEQFNKLDSLEELKEFTKWCNSVQIDLSKPNGMLDKDKLDRVLTWMKAFELEPDRSKLTKWRQSDVAVKMNREAIDKGKGLFATVGMFAMSKDLKEQWRYVTYMMFLAYNKADGPLDWGDHEGDWICVDLLIYGENDMKLVGAFFHHHGDKTFVPAERLRIENGAVMAFLEKGSNEPFWAPGPAKLVRLDFELGNWTYHGDFELERSHMGRGMKYNSKGKAVLVRNPSTIEGELIYAYPGQWGEEDVDRAWTKRIIGDVTNPPSPRWQEKMWTHERP